ncbi:SDR family NAD(P)-dependent oxidoreductase [Rheinheimera texasensis]|uniref:SDR family NAD(P)-dependent oxidoreductase n=1 Tax=Rheinheimera texasensis TaxID=306205 RepID=UPI0005624DEA|nr:SDR family oxidoreductase [Rheinheimera texasensis]
MTALYSCLRDKAVFITGGATGIGATMVRTFVQQGCYVAFIDLNAEAGAALLAELQAELPAERASFAAVDVTDVQALQQAIDAAAQRFGRLDVLVNNVANDQRMPTAQVTPANWRQCHAVNLDAAFFATQVALPFLQQQASASVINFSSVVAVTGKVDMAGYVTAKAGLIGLTKALAREAGAHGVRVNAVLPGWVRTERQLNSWFTPEQQQRWLEDSALKRFIQPEDVANLALFLASEQSVMITGQAIQIDGGISLSD